MTYEADANVTGPLAGVGQRLMGAAARRTTEQFLERARRRYIEAPEARRRAARRPRSREPRSCRPPQRRAGRRQGHRRQRARRLRARPDRRRGRAAGPRGAEGRRRTRQNPDAREERFRDEEGRWARASTGCGRSTATAGRSQPGEVVRPDERLRMPYMLGPRRAAHPGHVRRHRARAGADRLPGHDDDLLLRRRDDHLQPVTRNRVPSYTGSSFAFIAPVIAAKSEGLEAALGGIVAAGIALFLVGLLVDRAGYRVIEFLLPPVVTGSIVALIGLNLAPVARQQFEQQAGIALVTLVAILIIGVAVKSFVSRLSVFLGVVVGYVVRGAARRGQLGRRRGGRLVRLPGLHDARVQRQRDPADRARRAARAAGRERRARQGRRDDDRAGPRPADRPLVHGRRRRDHRVRRVRRLGHHDLRREHRRHGLHARSTRRSRT